MFLGFAIHSMYRNVDIDDVILNATGAFIGFGIYKILPKSFKKMQITIAKIIAIIPNIIANSLSITDTSPFLLIRIWMIIS